MLITGWYFYQYLYGMMPLINNFISEANYSKTPIDQASWGKVIRPGKPMGTVNLGMIYIK